MVRDDIETAVNKTLQMVDECERLLGNLELKKNRLNIKVIERNVVNDVVTPKSKSKAKNRAANQAALQLLMETYPKVFNRDNVRPLKIGIQDDLIAEEKVAKNKIKRALASYVRAPQYFRSLQDGADRINLQGEPQGQVTAEEAEHAKGKLKEFHQHRREIQRENEKQQREIEKADRIHSKLDQLVALNKR
jgi:ProP effector